MQYRIVLILALLLVIADCPFVVYGDDFVVGGTWEAAIDLPRIYFLLSRDPNGAPIYFDGNFELNYAFLDTGASGILLSKETAVNMGIAKEEGAVFVDVGVGGEEDFDVSEQLYIGTAGYNNPDADDPDAYSIAGNWRFQLNQDYALDPIDVLGIPLMAGKTVIFDPSGTNEISNFTAEVVEASDASIPEVDFKVPVRFEKYINPGDERNVPPVPVLAYNPVIDNIEMTEGSETSAGTWLFDTGATYSLMSSQQAQELGFIDSAGGLLVVPDFTAAVGGVGGEATGAGFFIDELVVPTICGYDLVFENAPVAILDIGIYNVDSGEFEILDGIFGSNFLCATMNLATWQISATPFDSIVLDTQNALLGFDVNPAYPVSSCGASDDPFAKADLSRDGAVGLEDIAIFAQEWLADCDWLDWNCRGADQDRSGMVNLIDYAEIANGL